MADNRGRFPRLFPRLVPVPESQIKAANGNGNGHQLVPLNTKATLLPRGAYGEAYEFFSPDGGHTIIDIAGMTTGHTILALAAYWHVATRWRAQKIAEAPLMVVEEDQDSGGEEWISDHELVEVLDMPSPDYDMGELLERTSRYLDDTAEALWVIDSDRIGRVRRLTPFRRGEFTVKPTRERLYGEFEVSTRDGPRTYTPEQVCYFRDSVEGWRHGGRSRLEVAMSWLRLGEKSRQTIRDLLENSVWPSAVIIPDKEWNPDPMTLAQYKADISAYGMAGAQGKPFVQLGGGSFVQLSAKIRDLVPEEVLNRVESVVAAVSGVPAIVLQFQVGMENSPWSQMEQARKMAYDDTIIPSWRKLERVITRQLLRPIDDDTTHFIRFDRSKIASLQENQQEAVLVASLMGRAASLNERRERMGLEPVDDPAADEIPELSQPMGSLFGGPPGGGAGEEEEEEETGEDEEETEDEEEETAANPMPMLQRKQRAGILYTWRQEAQATWKSVVNRLLQEDADEVAQIVRTYLTDPGKIKTLSTQNKARAKGRVMTAVMGYLKGSGETKWARATTPLLVQASERSVAFVAADIGINYNVLHPVVVQFAQAESAFMIEGITKTSRDWIADVISAGIEEGRTTAEIANLIKESSGFSQERAELIARTETTRAFNGAPQKALVEYQKATGTKFVKTWSSSLDDRVRDEHQALEGETVPIDQPFSNGLHYPAEPNCRCTALHSEVPE